MSSIPIGSFKPTRPTETQETADAKMRDVSKLYEKQFLREMVKAMRSTVDRSDLQAKSMAEDIFTEKLDHQYVESWGDTGGIGLADVIYNQLKDRFSGGPKFFTPQGPVPIEKGTIFKVDETKPMGIPVVPTKEGATKGNDLTYQIKVDQDRNVRSPWDGKVAQSFSGPDERQTIKLEHDNGLVSTLSFSGRTDALNTGDAIKAGQRLGQISPDHGNLTWQLIEVRKGT